MLGERLAVEGPRKERLARHRLLAIEATSELLVQLELLRAPLDFLFAVIRAEKDELACRRLDAGRVEHRLQRDARPLAVAAEPIHRPAIAGALETGYQIDRAQLLQVVERQRLRPVDEARHLQLERGRVDVRMTVMLGRGELVFRDERAINGAKVERAPVRRRFPPLVVGDVGELDDRLALGKRGQNPVRNAERAQARHRQASSKNLPTRVLYRHTLVPSFRSSRANWSSAEISTFIVPTTTDDRPALRPPDRCRRAC